MPSDPNSDPLLKPCRTWHPTRSGQDADCLLLRVGDAVASRTVHAALLDSPRLCKDL